MNGSDTMNNESSEIIQIVCIMGIALSVYMYIGSPTKLGT